MTEERFLKKPDGTYVLVACKSVGIDHAYPQVKHMHGFTNNGFPKNNPERKEEPSVWAMFRRASNHSA